MKVGNFTLPVYLEGCYNKSSEFEKQEVGLYLWNTLTPVRKLWNGYIPIPFVIIALVMSIVFIAAVIKAMKEKRVNRKCYLLIIDRSLGDVLTCLAGIATFINIVASETPKNSVHATISYIYNTSKWSATCSYISLSLLKLYAVARPVQYRQHVTMRRCIYFIILSWAFFVLRICFFESDLRVSLIPSCDTECFTVINRIMGYVQSTLYLIVIVTFTLTAFYLHKARKRIQANGSNMPTSKFPIWKLAINVSTFAVFYLPDFVYVYYFNLRQDMVCHYATHVTFTNIFYGMVKLCVLFRIIADATITLVVDKQIRKSLFDMMPFQFKFEETSIF